jgi:RNA polymerase sigma factor (sigma-70 family)
MPYSPFLPHTKKVHFTNEELVSLYVQTGLNYYFGLLYVNCSQSVYCQCLFLVKDPTLAQDLTHDIFLKLISGLVSFKGKSRFSSWLCRVTYNHCMDQFGLRKRQAEIPLDGKIEITDELARIDPLVGDPTELANLNSALNSLPPKEKEILSMRYIDNVSIPEIAVRFKVTVSAVKMRLARSRKKLRISYIDCYSEQ